MLDPETQTTPSRSTEESGNTKTLEQGFSTVGNRLQPCTPSSSFRQAPEGSLTSGTKASTENVDTASFMKITLPVDTSKIVCKPGDKKNRQDHATVCKNSKEQVRQMQKNTYKRKRSTGKEIESSSSSSQFSVKSWPNQSGENDNFLSCMPVAATSTSTEGATSSASGGAGSSSLRRCTNCQLSGHDRRNCPKPRLDHDGQEIKFKRKCSRCGEYGHDRRLCAKSNSDEKIGGSSAHCVRISDTRVTNRSGSLLSEAKGIQGHSFRRKTGASLRTKKKTEQNKRDNKNVQSTQSLQSGSKSPHRPTGVPPSTLGDVSQESFSLKILKEKLKKFSQARVDADTFRNSQCGVQTTMGTPPLFTYLPKDSLSQSKLPPQASMETSGGSLVSETRRKGMGAEEVGKAHVGDGSGDESEQSSAANSTFDSPLHSGMEGGIVPSLLASLLSGVGVSPFQSGRNLSENPCPAKTPLGPSLSLLGDLNQQQFHKDTTEFINQNGVVQPNINQLFSTFLSQQKMAAVMAMNIFKAAEHNLMKSQAEQDQ